MRAVFEAHGEILTVPAEKGDIRDITNSPGVADRDPAWSPDGKWIAYFSDESGEYALHLRAQNGMGEVRKINLGNPPSFFYGPTWSPDSKKIAYTDKRLNLWYVDLDKATPVKVDTDYYQSQGLNPALVARQSLDRLHQNAAESFPRRLCLFARHRKIHSDHRRHERRANIAVFDKNGKYLYFTASTNIGPTIGGLDMSTDGKEVTRSVYVIVLRKDLPSPLAPESDEEKTGSDKKDADNSKDASKDDSDKGQEERRRPGQR